MKDSGLPTEQDETPEDVATLYTWANLHGAKYRDFSASRALTREQARLRVQDALEQERVTGESSALPQAESERPTIQAQTADDRLAEARAIMEAEQAAQDAYRKRVSVERPNHTEAQKAAGFETPMEPPAWRQVDSSPVLLPPPQAASQPAKEFQLPGRPLPSQAAPSAASAPHSGLRQSWDSAEVAQDSGRPAWLASPPVNASSKAIPQAPEDTLQGSRERVASRWFALKGVFDETNLPSEAAPAPVTSRAPVLAVFSLAGGVGKTSLVATLGRALSERGERVLLVDTSSFGLLPFYFGAHDQRPGVLRTFSPPGPGGDSPIQMIALDPEAMGSEQSGQDAFGIEVARHSVGVSRVLIDLATASGATTRRVLRFSPMILVPILPDMNSVVSVGAIDAFFQHNGHLNGGNVLPYYLLNQFDAALPLHLDVREVLRQQLGDRMLPFAMRRSAAVSDAMAEGMTVMDYAPNSTAAEDFNSLAGWIKSHAAPANSAFRGVRWSER